MVGLRGSSLFEVGGLVMNPTLAVDNGSDDPSRGYDYVLVGGGLQSGLMALAIAHHHPAAKVLLIEQQGKLAGNHTWSFHDTDLTSAAAIWAAPLIEHRWPEYQIRVGGRVRTVRIPYRTCSSTHFSDVITSLMDHPSRTLWTGTTVTAIEPHAVTLGDGSRIEANVVIDNRGPAPLDLEHFAGGFQKFWGFELELSSDWPHPDPIVMDDSIDQRDGFRFVYTLPFGPRRVLVEDTRFSNNTAIDRGECLQRVREYTERVGCADWRIVREEHGILPMPTSGFLPGGSLPRLAGGYRGGFFHAATGYSFPMAVRLAETVATRPAERLPQAWLELAKEHAWRARFARFLNRLLFELVKPETRYQIFRRFYRVLDESSIARFYGHRFTPADAFRIVVGFPPMGLRPFNFLRSYWRVPAGHSLVRTSNQPSEVPG